MLIRKISTKIVCIIWLTSIFFSCESYVDINVPNDRITGETVFTENQTAISALEGLYSQLFNTSFAAGGNRSVTFLSGLSSDNFEVTSPIQEMEEFSKHEIFPSNNYNFDLWSGAYKTIYMANALIQGAENSSALDDATKDRLLGESKFIRAFTYFYLVNLYESVPLILDIDYRVNALVSNDSQEEISSQILIDLNAALELTGEDYPEGNRSFVNSSAVRSLLARVYLFEENWEQAEYFSSQVISASNLYSLNENLDNVFLPNSPEAIWQISPEGWGGNFRHTREGNLFIRISTNSSPVQLSPGFMELWEEGDLRFLNWIGTYSDDTGQYNFPFKYKVQYDATGGDLTEYSTVLRLAEQYLIRAEARARSGNIEGAIQDLDKIRNRANISLFSETNPGISGNELLQIILSERRKELFAEWGHRWLDLKRTNTAEEILGVNSSLFESTDLFYPIPEQERMKNPNLAQNDGY